MLEPSRRARPDPAPPGAPQAIDDALALVGLADRADDPVSAFSKGMQQRLGLGVALLGDPDLVLLDEPTSALDPVGRTDVRAIVRAARDRGATVILNSHLLTEVERVCDRVVILDHGRIIASGSLDEVVAVRRGSSARDRPGRRGSGGRCRRSARSTLDGDWLTVRPLAADRIPDLVAAMVAAGGRVHAVEPGRGSLEARFLELLGESVEPEPMIVIARLTVKELVRRRVVWVLAILTLRLGRARRLGPRPARRPGPRGRLRADSRSEIGVSQVLILIAFMFSFVLAMTAAFVGAPAVGGDLESGVAYAILARPLRRADLLLGRWLGSAVVVAAYAVASGLLAIAVAAFVAGLLAARPAAGDRVPGRRGARAADADPGARVGPAVDRGRGHRGRRLRPGLDGGRPGRRRRRRSAWTVLASVAEASRWLLPTDGLWRGVIYGLEPPSSC